MRRETEARRVLAFKHALVMGDDTYPVTRVRKRKDRVRITSATLSFIFAASASVTVEVIDDGDDDDPVSLGLQETPHMARRAAKPPWRLGRRIHRPRRRPVRSR